jgi:hypothetical protein
MSILDKMKAHIVLFSHPHKTQRINPRKNSRLSEILGRNGLSDEEWEAKKREHPGLFAKEH